MPKVLRILGLPNLMETLKTRSELLEVEDFPYGSFDLELWPWNDFDTNACQTS